MFFKICNKFRYNECGDDHIFEHRIQMSLKMFISNIPTCRLNNLLATFNRET